MQMIRTKRMTLAPYDPTDETVRTPIKPVKCLIMDDSRFDRRRVVHTVNRSGLKMDVTDVTSIREARDTLAQQKFDLHVFDLNLPDGNGIEFAAEVLSASRHRKVPTIILTGENLENGSANALLAGCADYLTKDTLTPESFRISVINALHKATVEAAKDDDAVDNSAIKTLTQALLNARRTGDAEGLEALARRAFGTADGDALPSALQQAIDELTRNCHDISGKLSEIEQIAGEYID